MPRTGIPRGGSCSCPFLRAALTPFLREKRQGLALRGPLFLFAVIEVNYNGNMVSVDARPSDAIALALRVNAPIFVTEKVVSKAKSMDIAEEKEETDRWKEWLENLKPEDFGKYKM